MVLWPPPACVLAVCVTELRQRASRSLSPEAKLPLRKGRPFGARLVLTESLPSQSACFLRVFNLLSLLPLRQGSLLKLLMYAAGRDLECSDSFRQQQIKEQDARTGRAAAAANGRRLWEEGRRGSTEGLPGDREAALRGQRGRMQSSRQVPACRWPPWGMAWGE